MSATLAAGSTTSQDRVRRRTAHVQQHKSITIRRWEPGSVTHNAAREERHGLKNGA
jgi:hypothetical protein